MEIDVATAWEVVSDALDDQDALVQGARSVSYRQFEDAAARFASALEAVGAGHESKVALYLYNCPEYLIAQFGAQKNRSTPVNVNYRYLDDELAYLLDDSDAEVLVFHSSLGDRVERVKDRCTKLRLLVEVDDDGQHLSMLYTGGTTGMPKGVMSRQGPYVGAIYRTSAAMMGTEAPTTTAQIATFARGVAASGRFVAMPCCPLMHGTGLGICSIPALLRGGTVVLLEQRTFDPHEVWSETERLAVAVIVIVGDAFARPMLRALEEREREGRPYDTSSVLDVVSGGAIWSAEIKDALAERLAARLTDMLASSEGGLYAVSIASRDAHVATARFALSEGARVLTEDGRDVVPGSDEEGLLASPSNAFGYKDPAKTAKVFREIEGRNYVLTGDWAKVDADGGVTLLGRGSNCINSGGEKIFPEEVEEAVKRHDDVDDCLVVGLADERFGQRVVAVVGSTSATPPTGDDLREWLRPTLSHFKIPRSVIMVPVVRRAPNGKADYRWAKDEAIRQLGAGPLGDDEVRVTSGR
jgi:acyl-CoA synthetase (AMP-forming)/AMP-acid ligase II